MLQNQLEILEICELMLPMPGLMGRNNQHNNPYYNAVSALVLVHAVAIQARVGGASGKSSIVISCSKFA